MNIVDYGKCFIGVPYRWGGKHPLEGYDCSGFVLELMRASGIYSSRLDMSSGGIYDYLTKSNGQSLSKPKEGAFLFFGNPISHVAIAINDKFMLEAGGGDRRTIDNNKAIEMEAMVRIRPISTRRDLVAIIKVDI